MATVAEVIAESTQRISDLEQSRRVAQHEGHPEHVEHANAEIARLRELVASLKPLAPEVKQAPQMVPCNGCGNLLWPEAAPTCDNCLAKSTGRSK